MQAGEELALYSPAKDVCLFDGGAIPTSAQVYALEGPSLPVGAGEALTLGLPPSPPGYEIDLAATLVTNVEDASVTTSALGSNATTDATDVLASTVTNNGTGVGQITFTDQVPSGLRIDSAATGLGTCSVSGQTVTCTIDALPVGASVPVEVVVTAAAAGSYTNQVSVGVQQGYTDPNPANDSAAATLTVTAPASSPATTTTTTTTTTPVAPQQAVAPRSCVVPAVLRDTPLAVARGVLRDLGCRVRALRRHSTLRRGVVIRVLGRAGRYPYQRLVRLAVSSGPRHRRTTRHRHRHR